MGFFLEVPWWNLVIRCAAIYLALFIILRIFGKREIGQFTIFDLVFVLLVANAVQPAMTGPDSSLLGGFIIILVLVVMNRILAFIRSRLPSRWSFFFDPTPTVIARDGAWDFAALGKEGVDHEDCEMALREHGVASIMEVKLAVLEADGSISVIPTPQGARGRRVRRKVRLVAHR